MDMSFKINMEPDIPAALSHINNLSNDELKDLINDDDKFEELIKNIEQFKELETEKEMLMASNRSLAEFNLAKQPELEEGKGTLRELSEKGNELCSRIKEKLEQMRGKSDSMSVETALDLLQTSAAEIEEESEKIAEKFLAGDMEVDEFLEQFLPRRNLMHLRKVKVDKMRDLMKKTPSGYPPSGPGYPIGSNFPGMTPSLPYPAGIVSMPMPL